MVIAFGQVNTKSQTLFCKKSYTFKTLFGDGMSQLTVWLDKLLGLGCITILQFRICQDMSVTSIYVEKCSLKYDSRTSPSGTWAYPSLFESDSNFKAVDVKGRCNYFVDDTYRHWQRLNCTFSNSLNQQLSNSSLSFLWTVKKLIIKSISSLKSNSPGDIFKLFLLPR